MIVSKIRAKHKPQSCKMHWYSQESYPNTSQIIRMLIFIDDSVPKTSQFLVKHMVFYEFRPRHKLNHQKKLLFDNCTPNENQAIIKRMILVTLVHRTQSKFLQNKWISIFHFQTQAKQHQSLSILQEFRFEHKPDFQEKNN